jgi:tellurite resistance protein TerC
MSKEIITYIVFGVVLLVALVVDLGLLSKKNKEITLKKAMFQTIFWVLLAIGFFAFLWMEDGHQPALEYISAYLMEWSLSIDNIFVFVLIFTSFSVSEKYYY